MGTPDGTSYPFYCFLNNVPTEYPSANFAPTTMGSQGITRTKFEDSCRTTGWNSIVGNSIVSNQPAPQSLARLLSLLSFFISYTQTQTHRHTHPSALAGRGADLSV